MDEVGVGSSKRAAQADAIEGVNLDAACGRGVSGEVMRGDEALETDGVCGVVGAGRAVLWVVGGDVVATQLQLAGDSETVAAVIACAGNDGPMAVIGVVGE